MSAGTKGGSRLRAGRLGRWVAAIGSAGLGALGIAYGLTYEPAPRVRVQWREDLPSEQRGQRERTYLLVNPRDPIPGGSIAYDLLDTSTSNIRALVGDPAVTNTGDIDENVFVVPFQTEYGESWMWIAHRTPGLRDSRVRSALIAGLAALALGGLFASRRRNT